MTPGDRSQEPSRTAAPDARTRRSWWPGWIWSVPIAALGITAWLLLRAFSQGGTDVTIRFADADGVKAPDTAVLYRGLKVGHVTKVALADRGDAIEVTANLDDDAARFLTTGTRFWLHGAKPSLTDLSSLGAIFGGPSIEMERGPGEQARHFVGRTRKPVLPADAGPAQRFRVTFDGAVDGLDAGEAVKLGGVAVGEVDRSGFTVDVGRGTIATSATVSLHPRLFHLADATGDFRATLGRLVEAGLRARLERTPPVVGSPHVALAMVPDAPPAQLAVVDGVPDLPTAPGDGTESVLARVQQLPLAAIGRHVEDATRHLDELVASPALHDSLVQLDASLRQVHELVRHAAPDVRTLVQRLDETASALQRTAHAAHATLGGATAQTGLTDTLAEVKQAARAVRSLASYLDRHPEALVTGRSGG